MIIDGSALTIAVTFITFVFLFGLIISEYKQINQQRLISKQVDDCMKAMNISSN